MITPKTAVQAMQELFDRYRRILAIAGAVLMAMFVFLTPAVIASFGVLAIMIVALTYCNVVQLLALALMELPEDADVEIDDWLDRTRKAAVSPNLNALSVFIPGVNSIPVREEELSMLVTCMGILGMLAMAGGWMALGALFLGYLMATCENVFTPFAINYILPKYLESLKD